MDNNSIQKYKNHHKAHFHEIDSVFFKIQNIHLLVDTTKGVRSALEIQTSAIYSNTLGFCPCLFQIMIDFESSVMGD
jgi:hypothetical protein